MTVHPLSYTATPEVAQIWTDRHMVFTEREIWWLVLSFHMDRGVVEHNPRLLEQLADTAGMVDLGSIETRERITRHDLKARLEETIAVADTPEVLHLGMTSADVVENSYLIRMAQTCQMLAWQDPRFSRLRYWSDWLYFRGIKGPVGTQQDQLDLLGDPDLCGSLDQRLADYFGFSHVAGSVPQVMWRSTDLQWASRIVAEIPTGPYRTIANGYLQMVAGYAGDTWNEGDVTSSSVRRVALPGIALAASSSTQQKGTTP